MSAKSMLSEQARMRRGATKEQEEAHAISASSKQKGRRRKPVKEVKAAMLLLPYAAVCCRANLLHEHRILPTFSEVQLQRTRSSIPLSSSRNLPLCLLVSPSTRQTKKEDKEATSATLFSSAPYSALNSHAVPLQLRLGPLVSKRSSFGKMHL